MHMPCVQDGRTPLHVLAEGGGGRDTAGCAAAAAALVGCGAPVEARDKVGLELLLTEPCFLSRP